MRIVIDGPPGSGKTTFLSCNFLRNQNIESNIRLIPNIADLGYTVFSELIQGSINEAKTLDMNNPPKNDHDWRILFTTILKNGIIQFEQGCNNKIYWYDRGIPFISVLAAAHNIIVPNEVLQEFKHFVYDYVFIFEMIESYDLSKIAIGKFKTLTLKDRYNQYKQSCDIYQQLGYKVHKVPVFSQDPVQNFYKRFQYIKQYISFNDHPLTDDRELAMLNAFNTFI